MERYTNRKQRDLLALLMLLTDKVLEIGKDDLFDPGIKQLKSGKRFLVAGIRRVCDTLDEGERERFRRLQRQCTIKVIEKTQPEDDMIRVSQEVVYSLAEMAIANHCVGCQRHDWKDCRLQQNLSAAWIPQAGEGSRKECRFSQ